MRLRRQNNEEKGCRCKELIGDLRNEWERKGLDLKWVEEGEGKRHVQGIEGRLTGEGELRPPTVGKKVEEVAVMVEKGKNS